MDKTLVDRPGMLVLRAMFLNTPYPEFRVMCQNAPYLKKVCEDEMNALWAQKTTKDFGENIVSLRPEGETLKQQYVTLHDLTSDLFSAVEIDNRKEKERMINIAMTSIEQDYRVDALVVALALHQTQVVYSYAKFKGAIGSFYRAYPGHSIDLSRSEAEKKLKYLRYQFCAAKFEHARLLRYADYFNSAFFSASRNLDLELVKLLVEEEGIDPNG